MKRFGKELMLAVFLGLVVPAMLLSIMLKREDLTPEISPAQIDTPETAPESVALSMYLRQSDGTLCVMDMDTYLVGVLLAEMPASFAHEAKCAQAVVARTYTRKAFVTGGKHGDGSVCTNAACCQSYCSPEEYREKGGTEAAIEDAQAAVMETSGYVLTYDDELIEAPYFSCSGGSTEDAVAVWGTDFPYLRATESPGEEEAAHYRDSVTFSKEEFASCLGVELRGDPASWISDIDYTAGGGVASVNIGGTLYTGTQVRTLLGLRSTAFEITTQGDGITVTTRGFGHRVGMSQYGADAMAETGSTYAQILAHYYDGTTLKRLDEK